LYPESWGIDTESLGPTGQTQTLILLALTSATSPQHFTEVTHQLDRQQKYVKKCIKVEKATGKIAWNRL